MHRRQRQCDAIHVDVTLAHTAYLSVLVDHVHPFIKKEFLMAVASFSKSVRPATKQKNTLLYRWS